jgi:hypothetical protein
MTAIRRFIFSKPTRSSRTGQPESSNCNYFTESGLVSWVFIATCPAECYVGSDALSGRPSRSMRIIVDSGNYMYAIVNRIGEFARAEV